MKQNKFYQAESKGKLLFKYLFRDLEITLRLVWFDLWIGFYYDAGKKTLYFWPFFCICFSLRKRPAIIKFKLDFAIDTTKFARLVKDRLIEVSEKSADEIRKKIIFEQNEYARRMNYKVFTDPAGGEYPKAPTIQDIKNHVQETDQTATLEKFRQAAADCAAQMNERDYEQKELEREPKEPPEKGEYKLFGDNRKNGRSFANNKNYGIKPLKRNRESETKSKRKK